MQCSSWTPPPFFRMSSWQIRHNLSSLFCKRRTKACCYALNPTRPNTHLRTEPELVECRGLMKPTKQLGCCASTFGLVCPVCAGSSCTALTVTTATRYPLLLKNPAGRHIYWSSEPMEHIIGLENSQHTHRNGAEGLIVHDNDGIHFNLVSVAFMQTNQIFFPAS